MRITTTLRTGTMWLVIFGMFLPTATFGAPPTQVATAEIQDIVLRPDQSLHGLITDLTGQAYANIPVQVFQEGVEVANTTTDVEGQFVVHRLKGGACSVTYPDQAKQYRVWTHKAAPPTACYRILHHFGRACKAHGCKVCQSQRNPCGCKACGGVCKSCGGKCCQQQAVCNSCGCHCHGIPGGHVCPKKKHAFCGLLTSPIGLAAIAASIAVPLALNDDDDVNAS